MRYEFSFLELLFDDVASPSETCIQHLLSVNSLMIERKHCSFNTVKPVLSGHSQRRPKIGFEYRLSLNAGQKYSAILSTFIKLPFVFKTFVLSIFEWPLKTGFTVVEREPKGSLSCIIYKDGSKAKVCYTYGSSNVNSF